MRYFTSDLHLFHNNVIEYCNRPFATVEGMKETIIQNWCAKVSVDDEVFVLGDFAFSCTAKRDELKTILETLPGVKHLIMGNHDRKSATFFKDIGFTTVEKKTSTVTIGGEEYRLQHRPDTENIGKVLCGHAHDVWMFKDNNLNVGVDCHNFTPISEDEVLELYTRLKK